MSIKNDRWIREMATRHLMIDPCEFYQVRSELTGPLSNIEKKVISYGVSSFGYDIRCSDQWKIFTNVNNTVIDPKNFDRSALVDFQGDVLTMPPYSYALGHSVERFKIPRDVMTICLGKSTYARCGIIVNVTPAEPEWEGYLTLEFANPTPLQAKIYSNEGCAQLLFFKSDEPCEISYGDGNRKYQNQDKVVTLPRV